MIRLLVGVFLCSLFFFSSCATWYERTSEFQQTIETGNFEKADKLLRKDKRMAKGKNKILFYLNLGYVEFMAGHPKESNQAFETAEQLIDEQVRNPALQAAVLLSNPEILPYKPEDFEVIMVNFYKSMNYLQMGDMEGAMVEVRKINIKLQQLNDKYPDHKNRYQRDAFAHLLMGLIYDASGNYNDAFIAYRNAFETYQTDYQKNFGLGAPDQLKQDLMRTAYLCGFTSELKQYEREFEVQYHYTAPSPYGQLVFFWLNGLGPVKSEWGINFVKERRGDGAIVFHNAEYGLTFPFFWGSASTEEQNSLADLKIVRAVFPKYVERPLTYTQADLRYKGQRFGLEMAEDINQIAFKTLHDRMVRELSTSLLRVATKQGIQYAASKQNEWVGFFVGLANAATEKADTRNWQTLPYSISYRRIPLQAQENKIGTVVKRIKLYNELIA
ncbi:COG3014 family protein, partial [Odoribacter laneus]|uniref:COG3014 family protein n=1 Tax=Odoribacter laneus TaxID=626933 RepID=UPI00249186E3